MGATNEGSDGTVRVARARARTASQATRNPVWRIRTSGMPSCADAWQRDSFRAPRDGHKPLARPRTERHRGPRSPAGTAAGPCSPQARAQIDRRTASRALHRAMTGATRARGAGSDAPGESFRAGSGRRNAPAWAIATRARWRHRAARSSSSSQQRSRNSISDWADDSRRSSTPAALHAPHRPARCCACAPPSSCSSTRY